MRIFSVIKKALAAVAASLLTISLGVVAQDGGGISGGSGGTPQGSTYATQYKSSSTRFGGTGPGTSGQVLTSNGSSSAPTFQTPASTTPAGSVGAIQYNNSGAFGGTGPGTSGQYLISNGAGLAPTFQSFTLPTTISGDHTLTGTWDFQGQLVVDQSILWKSRIFPSTLASGNTNNYAPSGYTQVSRIMVDPNATSGSVLTGIQNNSDAYGLWIQNIGTAAGAFLTLQHQSASSTAGNRFAGPGNTDYVIPPGGGVLVIYDTSGAAEWRIVGVESGPTYSFDGDISYTTANGQITFTSSQDVNFGLGGGTQTVKFSSGHDSYILSTDAADTSFSVITDNADAGSSASVAAATNVGSVYLGITQNTGTIASNATPTAITNGPAVAGAFINVTNQPFVIATNHIAALETDASQRTILFSTLHVKESATAPAIATAGTITTTATGSSRLAPAGAVIGIIMQSGVLAGQKVTVINESAAVNTITMAASGTSHVANGVSCVISGLTAKSFTWDSSTSLWYPEN